MVCGCVVVALSSAPFGGLKQQGPCKLKVGGRAPVPPPMSVSGRDQDLFYLNSLQYFKIILKNNSLRDQLIH